MLHPLRRFLPRDLLLAASLVTLSSLCLISAPPAQAQYLYLDTNGDGVSSGADVIAPSGQTTLDVWVRTNQNRDGSAATCASNDGDLTINGYQVVLVATNGTITWGAPVNDRPEFPSNFGSASSATELTCGFGSGATLAPGTYKLCTIAASVATGTPAVAFGTLSTLSPGVATSFLSSCSGVDQDFQIKLGVDFQDADGAAYGGVANHPPVLTPIADQTVAEGSALDVPVVATDADGDPLTYAVTSGPTYASILTSGGNASVHLAPGYSDAGDAQATVTASDAFSSAQTTFAIHVTNVNRPPVLVQPTDMMATEGQVNQMAVQADDPDGDAMTFYLVGAPSFVTIATVSSELGTATGLITSTPGFADAGMVTITVGAKDATLSDEKSYLLMVRNVDRPPVLTVPATAGGAEGERIEYDAVSTDPDGEIPSLTATGLPAGATFTDRMNGTARFHWVPLYGAAGDYPIAVTADDRAGATAAGTTTIHVAAATGTIKLAQPDDMSIVAGNSGSQILFASDANGDPLTFALDAGPAYASVTPLDPQNGLARATFAAAPPASAAGAVEHVTVSVTDGVGRIARDFVLTVIDPATLPGQTPFAPPFANVSTGLTPHTVAIADVDQDGILDLVTANLGSNSVSTYHGFGNLTFDVRHDFPTAVNPHTVIVRDLNGDGIPDLAMSQMGGLAIGSRLGLGDGAFGPISQCALPGSPMYLGIANFDGDDVPDAVATNLTVGALEFFHGNGDGTFTRVRSYPTGAAAHGLTIGDVNGDGKADVIVANPGPKTVSVLLGHGDGTFEPKPDFHTSSPHTLNLGDLDGDGILDLVVVNFDTGTITILRGVGDGTFVDPQEIPTGANAHGGTIADIDADGHLDILIANQAAGTLSILMGRGGMRFAPKADFAVAAGAHLAAVGDLDGDGDLDVAVSGIFGNKVTILENRMPPMRAARAFANASDQTLMLRSGKPAWAVRIESTDGAFRPEDVVAPVRLVSQGTGTVDQIDAMASKSWIIGDADRNGVPDVGVPFAKSDLRALFADLQGRQSVPATVEGSLLDGSRFRAEVTIDVVGAGKPGAPLVSPNPLNPSGTLSFTTDRDGPVRVAIYDVRGRLVRRVVNGERYAAGDHRIAIEGKDGRGAPLASGVYFFTIETVEGLRSGRFAVLK